ncbi:flavoprotein-like protein [Lipomyces kononenkoae]|uniref:Flavoprotein-like protein n=1 Tax=Lipomyces kononenkoae TaxID=34357 RepID=A0ACC3SY14_LIPKO
MQIGVIICSSRQPRVCPQIAQFVVQTIESTMLRSNDAFPRLNLIDLIEWNLPMFDEPDLPSQITDHVQYRHAHTRAWSEEIQRYNAFIFIVPQYNWGYPAVVKNAIDYLYNEWKGKPAMVVSYGGHGGSKCNAQLREVLCGVRMVPTTQTVELSFPSRDYLVKAVKGEDLALDSTSESGVWILERQHIAAAYSELLQILSKNEA